jgi:hypothetical protein
MTQERDPLPHPQLDDAAENHKHTAAWAATTRAQNWRNTTKFPSETTAAKPNLERSKWNRRQLLQQRAERNRKENFSGKSEAFTEAERKRPARRTAAAGNREREAGGQRAPGGGGNLGAKIQSSTSGNTKGWADRGLGVALKDYGRRATWDSAVTVENRSRLQNPASRDPALVKTECVTSGCETKMRKRTRYRSCARAKQQQRKQRLGHAERKRKRILGGINEENWHAALAARAKESCAQQRERPREKRNQWQAEHSEWENKTERRRLDRADKNSRARHRSKTETKNHKTRCKDNFFIEIKWDSYNYEGHRPPSLFWLLE